MLRTTLHHTTPLLKSPTPTITIRHIASTTSSSPNTNSSSAKSSQPVQPDASVQAKIPHQESPPARKTQAQLDAELQEKMAGLSGDGGEAGVEYEDGEPVVMKRSVKGNMFRYI